MTEDERPADEDAGGEPRREAVVREAAAPPPYEEITLADLVVTIWDHRRAALLVLLATLLVTAGFTAMQTPEYETSATMLVHEDRGTAVHLLRSRAYAEDVAREVDLVEALGDGNASAAGLAVRDMTTVHHASGLVTITTRSTDRERAAHVANAYVATFEAWRPVLENATFDRLWRQHYVETVNNTTLFNASEARRSIRAYIDGLRYHEPLDRAVVPLTPVSGNPWRLNMSLGATLALMLAFLTPFTLEAARNVRRELRRRG